MNRYVDLTTKKEDNKTVFETAINPSISKDITDLYIQARRGERLDNLAFRYYGDASKWVLIAQANNIGKGTLFIQEEIVLRIPINQSFKAF